MEHWKDYPDAKEKFVDRLRAINEDFVHGSSSSAGRNADHSCGRRLHTVPDGVGGQRESSVDRDESPVGMTPPAELRSTDSPSGREHESDPPYQTCKPARPETASGVERRIPFGAPARGSAPEPLWKSAVGLIALFVTAFALLLIADWAGF